MLSLASLTVGLVLVSAGAASAQADWGVQIGGGAAYLTVPKGTSRSMGADAGGGVFVNVPLIGTYRLQPELRFDHRRSKVLGTTRTFDYLDIPILVNMTLFKGIFINEGPAFHLPLRAHVESAGRETDVKSNTTSDISIVIGVGKKMGKVGVEGRWDSGLRRTQKTVARGDVATRHRSITALISVDLSE